MEELEGTEGFSRNVGSVRGQRGCSGIIEMDETVNGSIGIYIRDMTEK